MVQVRPVPVAMVVHLKLPQLMAAACLHKTTVTVATILNKITITQVTKISKILSTKDQLDNLANQFPNIAIKATWNIRLQPGIKTSTVNRTAKTLPILVKQYQLINILIRIRLRLINKLMQQLLRLRCIIKTKLITTITILTKITDVFLLNSKLKIN
jgi:hypothetical protein